MPQREVEDALPAIKLMNDKVKIKKVRARIYFNSNANSGFNFFFSICCFRNPSSKLCSNDHYHTIAQCIPVKIYQCLRFCWEMSSDIYHLIVHLGKKSRLFSSVKSGSAIKN